MMNNDSSRRTNMHSVTTVGAAGSSSIIINHGTIGFTSDPLLLLHSQEVLALVPPSSSSSSLNYTLSNINNHTVTTVPSSSNSSDQNHLQFRHLMNGNNHVNNTIINNRKKRVHEELLLNQNMNQAQFLSFHSNALKEYQNSQDKQQKEVHGQTLPPKKKSKSIHDHEYNPSLLPSSNKFVSIQPRPFMQFSESNSTSRNNINTNTISTRNIDRVFNNGIMNFNNFNHHNHNNWDHPITTTNPTTTSNTNSSSLMEAELKTIWLLELMEQFKLQQEFEILTHHPIYPLSDSALRNTSQQGYNEDSLLNKRIHDIGHKDTTQSLYDADNSLLTSFIPNSNIINTVNGNAISDIITCHVSDNEATAQIPFGTKEQENNNDSILSKHNIIDKTSNTFLDSTFKFHPHLTNNTADNTKEKKGHNFLNDLFINKSFMKERSSTIDISLEDIHKYIDTSMCLNETPSESSPIDSPHFIPRIIIPLDSTNTNHSNKDDDILNKHYRLHDKNDTFYQEQQQHQQPNDNLNHSSLFFRPSLSNQPSSLEHKKATPNTYISSTPNLHKTNSSSSNTINSLFNQYKRIPQRRGMIECPCICVRCHGKTGVVITKDPSAKIQSNFYPGQLRLKVIFSVTCIPCHQLLTSIQEDSRTQNESEAVGSNTLVVAVSTDDSSLNLNTDENLQNYQHLIGQQNAMCEQNKEFNISKQLKYSASTLITPDSESDSFSNGIEVGINDDVVSVCSKSKKAQTNTKIQRKDALFSEEAEKRGKEGEISANETLDQNAVDVNTQEQKDANDKELIRHKAAGADSTSAKENRTSGSVNNPVQSTQLEELKVQCDVCRIHFSNIVSARLESRSLNIHIPLDYLNICSSTGTEKLCIGCHSKYRICTDCGGGGKTRTGKYRPRDLFDGSKRTCILPHYRAGNAAFEFENIFDFPDLAVSLYFYHGQQQMQFEHHQNETLEKQQQEELHKYPQSVIADKEEKFVSFDVLNQLIQGHPGYSLETLTNLDSLFGQIQSPIINQNNRTFPQSHPPHNLISRLKDVFEKNILYVYGTPGVISDEPFKGSYHALLAFIDNLWKNTILNILEAEYNKEVFVIHHTHDQVNPNRSLFSHQDLNDVDENRNNKHDNDLTSSSTYALSLLSFFQSDWQPFVVIAKVSRAKKTRKVDVPSEEMTWPHGFCFGLFRKSTKELFILQLTSRVVNSQSSDVLYQMLDHVLDYLHSEKQVQIEKMYWWTSLEGPIKMTCLPEKMGFDCHSIAPNPSKVAYHRRTFKKSSSSIMDVDAVTRSGDDGLMKTKKASDKLHGSEGQNEDISKKTIDNNITIVSRKMTSKELDGQQDTQGHFSSSFSQDSMCDEHHKDMDCKINREETMAFHASNKHNDTHNHAENEEKAIPPQASFTSDKTSLSSSSYSTCHLLPFEWIKNGRIYELSVSMYLQRKGQSGKPKKKR